MNKSVISVILLPLLANISNIRRKSSANRKISVKNRDALMRHLNDDQERLEVFEINILRHNWGFGSIPKEIGTLENLQKLTLMDVDLDGLEIPKEIGQLINLEQLTINQCLIEKIPEEIGKLINLKELNLARNPISTLPDSIGNLQKLNTLRLQQTIIKELPESIGNLTNLEFIDLSRTAIEKLPESISNLQNLKRLHIYSYNFVLDETIGSLSGLQNLKVKGNITEIPFELGKLKNLENFAIRTTSEIKYPTKEILLHEWVPRGFSPSIAAIIVKLLPSSETSIRRF